MINVQRKTILAAALALTSGIAAQATDITIYDLRAGNNWGFAGTANPGAMEDQETEAGAITGQGWDLEAFTVNNGKLGIISGFDMKSGIGPGSSDVFGMGDIWVRIGSMVDPGTAVDPVGGQAWDYVIDITSWGVGPNAVSYNVYSSANAGVSPTANPSALITGLLWRAIPIANAPVIASGTADYTDNIASIAGYNGGNHDVLSGIDLSWLSSIANGQDVYFFTTMRCGNDLLHGKTTVPDNGWTAILMGAGLLGIGVFRRSQKA
jgi:hypothetical protein